MPWTERQQALLQAMGLRQWAPPSPVAEADEVGVAKPAQEGAGAAIPATAAVTANAEALPSRLQDTSQAAAPPMTVAAVAVGGAGVVARLPLRSDAVARGDLAGMDWKSLRQAVADCRACGLCDGRTQTVFGAGHESAHWLVVGEAPGEAEDQQGEPFVGPAGQLLDRMLAALALSRQPEGPPARRVYIANTLKCRPPHNRNPSADEVAHCEPFLMRQIELLQPRIILAMGRFAVQALLRSDAPIGRLRGQVHRYQGVPLVVTYHPAYLLRSLSEKAKAWEDLCLAADTAEQAVAP